MNLLTSLYLCSPGLVAYVNHESKLVYMIHTRDCLYTISRTNRSLLDGVHPSKELQSDYKNFEIETPYISDKYFVAGLRGMYNYHIADYKARGYRDLREGYNAGGFKLRCVVGEDYRRSNKHRSTNKLLVYVYAVSNRSVKTCLGVFETMEEAQVYKTSLCPTPESIIVPIRDMSELSVGYYKKKRTW